MTARGAPLDDQRTPLARVLGLGSARDGTGHWWGQRVSALALLILGCWFMAALAMLPAFGFVEVREWLGGPTSAVLMLLMIVSLAWHSNSGLQVVIEDYVHQPFARVASLIVVRFLHVVLAFASGVAALRMAFQ